MRFWLTILSLYMLALSFHPCQDKKPCFSHLVSLSVHDHHEAVHEEVVVYEHVIKEEDVCPPFCLCGCCSISLEIPDTVYFPLLNIVYSDPGEAPVDNMPAVAIHDIFEPPRKA